MTDRSLPDPRLNSLVILYVNTRPTNEDGHFIPLTPENILDNVIITDTSGDVLNNRGGREIDFETQVKTAGLITWFGAVSNVSTNPRDYVILFNVAQTGGNGTLNAIGLPIPSSATFVQGAISGAHDATVTYRISFNVHLFNERTNGWTTQTFHIDPKLRIH